MSGITITAKLKIYPEIKGGESKCSVDCKWLFLLPDSGYACVLTSKKVTAGVSKCEPFDIALYGKDVFRVNR